MSIIWTPSSSILVTIAYVLESITNVATSAASSSSSEAVSVILPFATRVSTSLMSIIWTPLSSLLATMAYVLEPITNVATSLAPLSSAGSSLFKLSFVTILSTSLMSSTWTLSLRLLATIAYVLEPIVNTSTPLAPLSFGGSACFKLSFATMFVGSLMSIIWTPPKFPCVSAATIAYVLEPITNVSTSVAPLSIVPASLLFILPFATMSVGSLMSIIWTPLS